MSNNVLADKDANIAPGSNPMMGDDKPKSLDYHRQMLANRMSDEQANPKFVSPSDQIMSPASQKLSAMKNKRFAKGKPQSLFAKTSSKNAERSGLGFESTTKPDGEGEAVQQGMDDAA